MRPFRIPLSNAKRWKIRTGRKLAQAAIPHGIRVQKVHLGYYAGMNFGDLLSPLVTEFVLGRPVVEGHYAGCDLVSVGSVLGPLEQ